MSKCLQCNVEVNDKTQVCPLCKCVLDSKNNTGVATYPNVRKIFKTWNLWARVYLVIVILLQIVLMYFNYKYYEGVWWSVISAGGFGYSYFVFRFAILSETVGYKTRIFGLILLGIAYVILIDSILGFKGWSANYVLPAGFLVVDGVTLGLMFWNKRNWQSYIMIEMMNVMLSFIPVVLIFTNVVTRPFFSYVNCVVAILIFIATLIIGDRRARSELRRRFHVR